MATNHITRFPFTAGYALASVAVCLLIGCDVASLVDGNPEYRDDMTGWERKAELETPLRMKQLAITPNFVKDWPPVEGIEFPNIDLIDHQGQPFSIKSLAGKPVLIEFIAMSCAGCQAFAGGNKYGGFEKFASQSNLKSFDEYFQNITGHPMDSDKLNVVQLIVLDLELTSPEPEALAKWREHFHLTDSNMHVVGGTADLNNHASFKMIPGFMLLDSNLKVLSDSTGHKPKRCVYTELLPQLSDMLQ